MVDVNVCVSSHLKEELTWAIGGLLVLQCYFKNSKSTKELKEIKK